MKAAIAAYCVDEPGPPTLELSVHSALPLVIDGRPSGDRGTINNAHPDVTPVSYPAMRGVRR